MSVYPSRLSSTFTVFKLFQLSKLLDNSARDFLYIHANGEQSMPLILEKINLLCVDSFCSAEGHKYI